MFGAILKATNSTFQKSMTFCRIIYVKKVMKLLAFIFEQSACLLHVIIELFENVVASFQSKKMILCNNGFLRH